MVWQEVSTVQEGAALSEGICPVHVASLEPCPVPRSGHLHGYCPLCDMWWIGGVH